jgi:hypothetical protein
VKELSGSSSSLSGQELLDGLKKIKLSGTLVLSHDAGNMLLRVDAGELLSSFCLGDFGSLADEGIAFHIEVHPNIEIPHLQSGFPGSQLAVLRALPQFSQGISYQAGLTDIRLLIEDLRQQEFTGSLTFAHGNEYGLALLLRGRIAAAQYERDGYTAERLDALRAIFRYSLSSGHSPLSGHPLNPLLVQSLLGLASNRYRSRANPKRYNGLSTDGQGYTFHKDGKAFLRISANQFETNRRYPPVNSAEDLQLPDEPPGWEDQRFILTLRGRDALNPMTDLSMDFREAFGTSGRTILKTLGDGETIEETGRSLDLALEELKPWVTRLEDDGFIRLLDSAEGAVKERGAFRNHQ